MNRVDNAIENIATRIGHGISLDNLDGSLVSYSTHHASDQARINVVMGKRVPEDVSAWELKYGIDSAVRPVVLPANKALGMLGRVCVPLISRGVRVGYLWVLMNGDEDSAPAILGQLADIRVETDRLSTMLLESSVPESEDRRRNEELLLSACNGSEVAINGISSWPGFASPQACQLAVLFEPSLQYDGPTAVDRIIRMRTVLCDVAQENGAHFLTMVGEGHSVVLSGTPLAGSLAETLANYPAQFGKRTRGLGRAWLDSTIIGVSDPISKLTDLPQAYKQAKVAVQAAAVDMQMPRVVHYNQIGVYQFLAGAGTLSPVPPFTMYSVLAAQDPNLELVHVLEALYDTNGSMADVADKLHVHRATVYNRLKRVQNIVGADPLSSTVRLDLHLAIKSQRWAKRPLLF